MVRWVARRSFGQERRLQQFSGFDGWNCELRMDHLIVGAKELIVSFVSKVRDFGNFGFCGERF